MYLKILQSFSKTVSENLSARKYMRSLSETALFYRPSEVRMLPEEENMRDRVVQTFFTASTSKIQVFEAANRLSQVSKFSTPAHSYYQFKIPFSTNEHLRKKMTQFYNNHIRIGRVLQLMDYIAANVAYRYCSSHEDKDKSMEELPFMTVTASIDQIDFFHSINADQDCTFMGYVSYVGKSSMEVHIQVDQCINGENRLACSAKFAMVARDKSTGKAYQVPQINIDSEPEKFRIKCQLGEKRQIIRKEESKKNLRISPPTYEESASVHNLLLQVEKQKQEENKWIPMSQTKQKSALLMHLQDKNLSGKIFGGFVLRLAYQLGWLAVFKFLKGCHPKCTHIDDVQFLAPVQIGSIIELEAIISYITPEIIHVIVSCSNAKPTEKIRQTNILRISFQHNSKEAIPQVYPETLTENNQYIQSMRRVNKYLKQ